MWRPDSKKKFGNAIGKRQADTACVFATGLDIIKILDLPYHSYWEYVSQGFNKSHLFTDGNFEFQNQQEQQEQFEREYAEVKRKRGW